MCRVMEVTRQAAISGIENPLTHERFGDHKITDSSQVGATP